MTISINNGSAAFTALCQVASEHAEELTKYESITVQPESDRNDTTGAPIMNMFIDGSGSDSIETMTNFKILERENLHHDYIKYANKRFEKDRGRKLDYTVPDILFLLLTVFRNGCTKVFF